MNLKLLTGASILTPMLLMFGVAVSAVGSGALDPAANMIGCVPAISPSAPVSQTVKDLNPTQLAHAKMIYDVSVAMKLPPRAAVVALATVAQESYFKNMANPNVPKSMTLPHEGEGADHDSVGLFQQRPLPPDGEGGWGTVEELMTPRISAMKFYTALQRVEGWESLPITVAAQRVQISAFPEAYAKHEPLAIALVALIGGGAVICQAGNVAASGWAKPGAALRCLSDGLPMLTYAKPGGTLVDTARCVFQPKAVRHVWAARGLGSPGSEAVDDRRTGVGFASAVSIPQSAYQSSSNCYFVRERRINCPRWRGFSRAHSLA